MGDEIIKGDETIKALSEIFAQDTKLKMLYDILIDNTELDYTGKELTIGGTSTLLKVAKCIDPKRYNKRIEDLKSERKAYLKDE